MSSTATLPPMALSAKDLAALLGISVRQIWDMDRNGMLGPVGVRFGERLCRWDRQEVEAWWAACRMAGRPVSREEWLRRGNEDFEDGKQKKG